MLAFRSRKTMANMYKCNSLGILVKLIAAIAISPLMLPPKYDSLDGVKKILRNSFGEVFEQKHVLKHNEGGNMLRMVNLSSDHPVGVQCRSHTPQLWFRFESVLCGLTTDPYFIHAAYLHFTSTTEN